MLIQPRYTEHVGGAGRAVATRAAGAGGGEGDMPVTGDTRAQRAGWERTRERTRRGLVVGVALAWCLLLLGIALGTWPDHAQAAGTMPIRAAATGSETPTSTATAAVTFTPTATPTQAAATATATTAAPPTATSAGSSGGAGSGSSGTTGQQPTSRQNLAQPTIGTNQGGPTTSFSPSDLNSPWMLVFSTLGCVFGLIGLGALLITWYLLVSDGWAPLLKAVLLGNRKGKRRFTRRQAGTARGSRQPERVPAPAMRQRGGWR